jgi:hypothetical protein
MENTKAIQPLLVSVRHAGDLLGVSKHSIRSWYYKGLLKGQKLGTRLLIPFTEIERISREGLH